MQCRSNISLFVKVSFVENQNKLKADLHIGRFASLRFAEKVETHSTFKTIRAYKRELKILRNNSNCACSSAVRFAREARATDMENRPFMQEYFFKHLHLVSGLAKIASQLTIFFQQANLFARRELIRIKI